MQQFDVFVIGTGTAGETAATILRDAGLSVGIADTDVYGGTCALRGCQPKKYLVIPAHAALEAQGLTERGFTTAPTLDWKTMQRSRAEFTDAVPAATEKGLREQGIATFHGACRFLDPRTLQCGDEKILAGRYLIAAGARPRPLSIPGGELALNSDDFLTLQALPQHITFIGGGYISMEFATVAAAAGAEVTVLQRGDRILDRFDPDLVEELRKSCTQRSMDIRTNVEPTSISPGAVHLSDGTTVQTDLVIAALGRIPNTDTLDLENAGLTAGPRGIETNSRMRTTVDSIYAVGDCVASIQLSPVSDAEARVAARNITLDLRNDNGGNSDDRGSPESRPELDLSVLPTVVFTYPQLAQFGLTEHEARTRGGVRINAGSGAGWPSYRRLNESHMLYKVMIDEESDRILGAHILAPHAGEMINVPALAARQGTTARELREIPWAYPTYISDLKYMLT